MSERPEFPFFRRQPGGRDLRVGILAADVALSDSESRLLRDVLVTDYVTMVVMLVSVSRVRRRLKTFGDRALMLLYGPLDNWLVRRRQLEGGRDADLSLTGLKTLTAGAVETLDLDEAHDSASLLLKFELDVILCPNGVRRPAELARAAAAPVWTVSPAAASLAGVASVYSALRQYIWGGTLQADLLENRPGIPSARVLRSVSARPASRASAALNSVVLRSAHRDLWLQGLWSLHQDTQRADLENATAPGRREMCAKRSRWRAVRTACRVDGNAGGMGAWRVGVRHRKQSVEVPSDLVGYLWVPSSRGVSYADPFLLEVSGRSYVFMEEFDVTTKKGRIACMEVGCDLAMGQVEPVLERPYHISYPHVFKHAGDVFMVPETGRHGCVELYRAVAPPYRWEFVRTLKEGALYDTTVLFREGRFWFFTTRLVDRDGYFSQLLLYTAPDLYSPWTMHPASPLSNDARFARGAGRIIDTGTGLVRPAQDCSRTYGEAINFCRVLELDESRYLERPCGRLGLSRRDDGLGIHTYDRTDFLEVIDHRARSDRLDA